MNNGNKLARPGGPGGGRDGCLILLLVSSATDVWASRSANANGSVFVPKHDPDTPDRQRRSETSDSETLICPLN